MLTARAELYKVFNLIQDTIVVLGVEFKEAIADEQWRDRARPLTEQ